MAKRREKGDGSIYQRESDGRYVAYMRLENGKKKYVYDKTRSGVVKKLKELQRNVQQGTIVATKSETVEAYLYYWLEIRREQNKIKEGTYINYKYVIRMACKHIGDIKLTKLTGDVLQQMYGKLQKDNKASTVNHIHRILSTAFKYAVKWKKLATNPCKDAEAPFGEKFEGAVLTAEQGSTILAEAKGHSIEIFLILALGMCMRRGEIIGLRWSAIDIEKKQLLVERTASYLPDEQGHRHIVEGTPKTKSSRRALALPQFVIDALKAHRIKQREQRLQAGSTWIDKNLVFCKKNGDYYNVVTLQYQFDKILVLAKVPHMRLHDLRHSAATLLLSKGVPMKVVQEILGHSSITITMDIYGHLLPGMQEDAMEKMDQLFQSR